MAGKEAKDQYCDVTETTEPTLRRFGGRMKVLLTVAAGGALLSSIIWLRNTDHSSSEASAQQAKPATVQVTDKKPGATTQQQPQTPRQSVTNTILGPADLNASPKLPEKPRAVGQEHKQLSVFAVVNGEQISRKFIGQQTVKRFGGEVLESIINKKLIELECTRLGILVTDKHVDMEIESIAKKFGLSVDRWLDLLQNERDIPIQKYREEIIWPALALRQMATKQIQVSPEELSKAYESEFGPKVKVRVIAVTNLEKAQQLLKSAKANPDDFGSLAKDHSEDPTSASARGLIPAIRKHGGEESIELAAFSLEPGEISEIVKVANQYLILKCEKRIAPTYVAPQFLADAKQRLHDQIRDANMQREASKIFKELKEKAKVVNIYVQPELGKQMPGVVGLVNNYKITTRDLTDECIMRHGASVLEGEINRKLLKQALVKAEKKVTNDDLNREIARAAESYGFLKENGDPDLRAWVDKVTKNDNVTLDIYVQDAVWPSVALEKLAIDSVKISQEDLEKGFESNYGQRVKVLAIVLQNQRQANMVWELAKNNPSDYFFGQLAEQYSVEPVSRENSGQVPPIRRHGGQPQLEDEAFRLSKGELSSIVAIGGKFIILRCVGHTEPVVTDLADVKTELLKELQDRKTRTAMNRTFAELVEASEVVNFLRPIKAASGVTPSAQPPMFQK